MNKRVEVKKEEEVLFSQNNVAIKISLITFQIYELHTNNDFNQTSFDILEEVKTRESYLSLDEAFAKELPAFSPPL